MPGPRIHVPGKTNKEQTKPKANTRTQDMVFGEPVNASHNNKKKLTTTKQDKSERLSKTPSKSTGQRKVKTTDLSGVEVTGSKFGIRTDAKTSSKIGHSPRNHDKATTEPLDGNKGRVPNIESPKPSPHNSRPNSANQKAKTFNGYQTFPAETNIFMANSRSLYCKPGSVADALQKVTPRKKSAGCKKEPVLRKLMNKDSKALVQEHGEVRPKLEDDFNSSTVDDKTGGREDTSHSGTDKESTEGCVADDDLSMSGIRPDGRVVEKSEPENVDPPSTKPVETSLVEESGTRPKVATNDVAMSASFDQEETTTPKMKKEHLTKETSSDRLVSSCIELISTNTNIEELQVDVIVSSDDPTLHSGGLVASIIARKGGHLLDVFKECVRQMCEHISNWTFQPTPAAGKLKCKHIFHAAIPKFSKQKQSESRWMDCFESLIDEILHRADHMGFESIALPLIGTGRNGAPVDFVIGEMCQRIEHFSLRGAGYHGYLKTVILVHPDKKVKQKIDETIKTLSCYSKNNKKKNAKEKTSKISLKSHFLDVIDRKNDTCPICMEEISRSKLKQLSKCKHIFCAKCLELCFKQTPACPVCNMVYGEMVGSQPDGIMVETFQRDTHLPGYKDSGTIHIYYSFLDGKQTDEHPHPGRMYRGTRRTAYLPDNKEGQKVHRLLRKAFNQRLLFTIGSSRTTGKDDVVTWNDIHHKTNITGGTSKYGYPDPDYLSRVLDELSAKGITEEEI